MSPAPVPPAHLAEATRAAARERPSSLPSAGTVEVAGPVPIEGPGGLVGWLVGVTSGERLLGFAQFDERGQLLRTSWFPARASVSECPLAAAWLDADTVRDVAATILGPAERLGPPRLTYDRDRSRVLWRVPVVVGNRLAGSIAVVGETGFREPAVPPDDRTG